MGGRYAHAHGMSSGPRFVIATQTGVSFQDDLHVERNAMEEGGYADQDEGQQQQQQQVYAQSVQYNGNQGGNYGNSHDNNWVGHTQAQHTHHQQHDDGTGSWGQQGGQPGPDQMGRGASPPIMMPPPSAGEGYEYGAPFAAQMTPPPATLAGPRPSYAPLPLLPSSPFMPTPQPQPQVSMGNHYGLPAVLFPNQGAYPPYPADGGWGLAQQQMQFMNGPPPLPQHAYPGTMGYGAGMYPF
jgi:hypothetical protein